MNRRAAAPTSSCHTTHRLALTTTGTHPPPQSYPHILIMAVRSPLSLAPYPSQSRHVPNLFQLTPSFVLTTHAPFSSFNHSGAQSKNQSMIPRSPLPSVTTSIRLKRTLTKPLCQPHPHQLQSETYGPPSRFVHPFPPVPPHAAYRVKPREGCPRYVRLMACAFLLPIIGFAMGWSLRVLHLDCCVQQISPSSTP